MALHNTEQEWGSLAKGLHWIVAILLIGLVPSGIYMDRLDISIPAEREIFLQLVFWHKSCGMLVLLLMLVRLCWRWMSSTVPALPEESKTWERHMAHSIHGLLYIIVIAQVLSGWLMSSAGGHPVTLFGWFEFPPLVDKNKEIGEAGRAAHAIMGKPLLILIFVLHVVGALKHHYVNKNNVLKRMMPW